MKVAQHVLKRSLGLKILYCLNNSAKTENNYGSNIARIIGKTQPAVRKELIRLKKEGFIERPNKIRLSVHNKIYFCITKKGQSALRLNLHYQFHSHCLKKIEESIKEMNNKDDKSILSELK